jgi:hypothetical protein
MSITTTLTKFGKRGVHEIKADVARVSATGESAKSVRYEVISDDDTDRLRIVARPYFSTIETGRGPRKSNQDGGFKDKMLDYMKRKGIGADLTEKKRAQLAKFLVYRINKEGDKTYKSGGRTIYSDGLLKLVEDLKKELAKDFLKDTTAKIKGFFNTKKAA